MDPMGLGKGEMGKRLIVGSDGGIRFVG